ncbi:MAG: prephenate dehydrogenase/arogenate dehydrogenase family protein, partial [Acidimicrobiaceae bacterium]|nr:prephenate dehydrogenase/arogenate dehydrogenase family protein [Acidimicrobiaceae bacterium]
MADSLAPVRRANIIGVGLIGGSIALGLREIGWHVTGEDRDPATNALAIELAVLDKIGFDADAE